MSVHFQRPSAAVLLDRICAGSKIEWVLVSPAELQALKRESLDEGLRFSVRWKPCGPHLDRHALHIARAAASPKIH